MKTYNQLTEIQRYQIEALNKAEKKQNAIAEILGVSPSTISRELKRNRGKRGYRPKQANIKAMNRREKASKTIKMTDDAIDLIEDKLYLDWSPEQISGWLKQEQVIEISHEHIYQHVWSDKAQGFKVKGYPRFSFTVNLT